MIYEHQRSRTRGTVMGRSIVMKIGPLAVRYETGREFAGERGIRRFSIEVARA